LNSGSYLFLFPFINLVLLACSIPTTKPKPIA
jgi:hypothetical protein